MAPVRPPDSQATFGGLHCEGLQPMALFSVRIGGSPAPLPPTPPARRRSRFDCVPILAQNASLVKRGVFVRGVALGAATAPRHGGPSSGVALRGPPVIMSWGGGDSGQELVLGQTGRRSSSRAALSVAVLTTGDHLACSPNGCRIPGRWVQWYAKGGSCDEGSDDRRHRVDQHGHLAAARGAGGLRTT